MLDTIISSKTRIKLLQKFFLNGSVKGYLRGLESEFGESSNAIRLELNKFEKAGMISSETVGNKKYFKANDAHPLFADLQNIVRKYMGIDKIIENVVHKLGSVDKVYVTGDYAKGLDKGIIDLLLIADDIDQNYLLRLIEKAEGMVQRKIRFLRYYNEEEANEILANEEALLIWRSDQNPGLA